MENNAKTITADREAIISLKAKYCRFVDTKQWDAFEELIVPYPGIEFQDVEGQIIYEFSDRKSFIESCAILENGTSVHHVYNPEIEILSPGNASAIWGMEDLIFFSDEVKSPFKKLHGYGHYHETYVKENGEWKIAALRLERLKLTIK